MLNSEMMLKYDYLFPDQVYQFVRFVGCKCLKIAKCLINK